MIWRVWNAYRVEWAKAVRHWPTFVGPALILGAVAAAFLVHPVSRDGESDYAFIAFATPLTINLLGFIVILVFSAGLVSGELASGTLRTILVQSVRRRDVLLAKFMLAATYVLVIDLVAAAGIWLGTMLLGDLSGVRFGGELLFTDREMEGAYALALALCFMPQCAVAAFGLLCSSFTRSGTAAASMALGLWLLIETVKHPLQIEPFVFFSYLEWPWQVFADRCDAIDSPWLPNAQFSAAISAATAAVLLTFAAVVLSRKDLST
jgi:ABC-type transport system involved in multi-copper enzyme maturation permease subunit